ncbi:GNAT family N-acetyltransferase [Enterococcus sp. LJL99]
MQKMYKLRKYSTLDHLIYKESLELRNELLRIPIGKSIYSENLKIEKDNTFFGAFEEEQLVGTLSYYEEADQIAHLTAFAVAIAHQKRGIGKKLLELLIQELQKKGYREIRVDARELAVPFYKKCGFEIVSGPVINQALKVVDFKMVFYLS